MAALFGKTQKSTDLGISDRNLQGQRKMDQPATKFTDATKQSFRRGQLKALGIAQIMLGLFFIAIGIPLFQSQTSIAAAATVPWWGGGLFIISGLLSIIAERKLTSIALRCCVVSNLLSAAASLSAVLLFAMDLRKCGYPFRNLSESHFSLTIILLIFALMELLITIAVLISGWNKAWECSAKGGELPQNSFDQNHTYESLITKEATYTSMRALKPLKVPAFEK